MRLKTPIGAHDFHEGPISHSLSTLPSSLMASFSDSFIKRAKKYLRYSTYLQLCSTSQQPAKKCPKCSGKNLCWAKCWMGLNWSLQPGRSTCPLWRSVGIYSPRVRKGLFPQRKMSAVSGRWGDGCWAGVCLEGFSLVLRDMAKDSNITLNGSLCKGAVIWEENQLRRQDI